jgi:hypothetical protein
MVTEHFTQSGNRNAGRERDPVEGFVEQSRGRRLPASQIEHVRRAIHTQDLIPGVEQSPGPDPASAPEVDDQAPQDFGRAKQLQNAWSGKLGKVAKAIVVNAGKILPVHRYFVGSKPEHGWRAAPIQAGKRSFELGAFYFHRREGDWS